MLLLLFYRISKKCSFELSNLVIVATRKILEMFLLNFWMNLKPKRDSFQKKALNWRVSEWVRYFSILISFYPSPSLQKYLVMKIWLKDPFQGTHSEPSKTATWKSWQRSSCSKSKLNKKNIGNWCDWLKSCALKIFPRAILNWKNPLAIGSTK